jgi:hypothetical protein
MASRLFYDITVLNLYNPFPGSLYDTVVIYLDYSELY